MCALKEAVISLIGQHEWPSSRAMAAILWWRGTQTYLEMHFGAHVPLLEGGLHSLNADCPQPGTFRNSHVLRSPPSAAAAGDLWSCSVQINEVQRSTKEELRYFCVFCRLLCRVNWSLDCGCDIRQTAVLWPPEQSKHRENQSSVKLLDLGGQLPFSDLLSLRISNSYWTEMDSLPLELPVALVVKVFCKLICTSLPVLVYVHCWGMGSL